MSPILTLDCLAAAARDWKRDGAVIVLAAGCFDPLHFGHVEHLRLARQKGNVLVVSVAGDAEVRLAKGPTRPRSPAEHRAGVVAALSCVDAAVICNSYSVVPVIHALRPHIFAKGSEYEGMPTPQLASEEEAVEFYGGRVRYLSGRVVCSSTAILSGC